MAGGTVGAAECGADVRGRPVELLFLQFVFLQFVGTALEPVVQVIGQVAAQLVVDRSHTPYREVVHRQLLNLEQLAERRPHQGTATE
ncbi:hypothetical protein ACIBMZ_30470 [Micromonospora sp. NPDC049900]|uniref:hypothetical protein n=1 Tax=Micromonospora sp. NPDC049900 TaxID=3364275 RepID=UPI0037A975D3